MQYNQIYDHSSVTERMSRSAPTRTDDTKRKGRRHKREDQEHVFERQRLGLKDGPHKEDVDEPELRQEQDHHGEYPVLRSAPQFWIVEMRSKKRSAIHREGGQYIYHEVRE